MTSRHKLHVQRPSKLQQLIHDYLQILHETCIDATTKPHRKNTYISSRKCSMILSWHEKISFRAMDYFLGDTFVIKCSYKTFSRCFHCTVFLHCLQWLSRLMHTTTKHTCIRRNHTWCHCLLRCVFIGSSTLALAREFARVFGFSLGNLSKFVSLDRLH